MAQLFRRLFFDPLSMKPLAQRMLNLADEHFEIPHTAKDVFEYSLEDPEKEADHIVFCVLIAFVSLDEVADMFVSTASTESDKAWTVGYRGYVMDLAIRMFNTAFTRENAALIISAFIHRCYDGLVLQETADWPEYITATGGRSVAKDPNDEPDIAPDASGAGNDDDDDDEARVGALLDEIALRGISDPTSGWEMIQ